MIAAVGDMACDPSDSSFHGGAGTSTHCQQSAVSQQLLDDGSVQTVLGLGDYQYDCGDTADYNASYDPTWGRLNSLMEATAGNHEYKTGVDVYGKSCPTSNATAQNYFNYFGASAHQATDGHFSFDLGNWHLIGLNANCSHSGVGGCAATSTQTKWLKTDLASTDKSCIAAFWHQPLFTGSGTSGKYRAWWDALYAADADVVLNGHVHRYQRFPAMNPSGGQTAAGLSSYIVGTGGENLKASTSSNVSNSKVLSTFGYLRMTLHSSSWDAQFINSSGAILDSSSGSCH